MAKKPEDSSRIIFDGKELNRRITLAVQSANTLTLAVQTLCLSALGHAIKHGDTRPATRLLQELPTTWPKTAMRAWFERNGPFAWERTDEVIDGKPVFAFSHVENDEVDMEEFNNDAETYLNNIISEDVEEGGKNDPVFIPKARENQAFSLDIAERVAGLLKQATNALKNEDKAKGVKHAELIPELERMLSKMNDKTEKAKAEAKANQVKSAVRSKAAQANKADADWPN